jgi:hypothetical protein
MKVLNFFWLLLLVYPIKSHLLLKNGLPGTDEIKLKSLKNFTEKLVLLSLKTSDIIQKHTLESID